MPSSATALCGKASHRRSKSERLKKSLVVLGSEVVEKILEVVNN
jgi:hypothetical protein